MTAVEYNSSVDMYADPVYRFILKNIRDEEKARDVVQDSFEKLWINIAKVEFEKVRSWLFTTAYRTMIDNIRHNSKQTNWDEINEQEQVHNKHWNDVKEVVNNALKTLNDIQRSVILLRDYEGYSYEEIGKICNLSSDQVKVYIFRGRQQLKNYIVKLENVI